MNLPVAVFFGRSLREGTRQIRTYVIRGALLLGLLSMLASAQGTSSYVGAPGETLFSLLAFMNLALIALAAPGYFASVITEEKEAGTLGLALHQTLAVGKASSDAAVKEQGKRRRANRRQVVGQPRMDKLELRSHRDNESRVCEASQPGEKQLVPACHRQRCHDANM